MVEVAADRRHSTPCSLAGAVPEHGRITKPRRRVVAFIGDGQQVLRHQRVRVHALRRVLRRVLVDERVPLVLNAGGWVTPGSCEHACLVCREGPRPVRTHNGGITRPREGLGRNHDGDLRPGQPSVIARARRRPFTVLPESPRAGEQGGEEVGLTLSHGPGVSGAARQHGPTSLLTDHPTVRLTGCLTVRPSLSPALSGTGTVALALWAAA